MKLKHLTKMFSCLLVAAVVSTASFAQDDEPYPLEFFALREAISVVEVSPDGSKLAMLKILMTK